jgi:plastocyanin
MRSRPLILIATLIAAAAGAAAAGVAAHAGATAKTITVTAREYHIGLSTSKTTAGPATLVVKNAGKLAHQIEIKGPGVTKKTPLLQPGKKATLKVKLASGKYAVWCTVPGHAALGMKATLTVAGAASGSSGSTSGGSTTTTSTTTTSGGGGGDNAWG